MRTPLQHFAGAAKGWSEVSSVLSEVHGGDARKASRPAPPLNGAAVQGVLMLLPMWLVTGFVDDPGSKFKGKFNNVSAGRRAVTESHGADECRCFDRSGEDGLVWRPPATRSALSHIA